MKYRDHSLRYVPRRSVQKPARPVEQPVVKTQPEPDEDNHFKRVQHDEPLIDIHDTSSRIENVKETLGGIHHAAVEIFLPYAKKHTKRVYAKARPVVTSHTKTAASTLSSSTRKLPLSKKHLIQLVVVIILFASGYGLAHRTQQKPPTNAGDSSQNTTANEPIGGTSPTYDTVLPDGKSIDELGGWSRVSPPDRNPVFAYVDTLERVEISVSQQPMPSDFSNNPDEDIKELALGFNAKERVVADDATVYFIGTSTKGPQSVILAKKGTLILIKSPIQIKNEVWSEYIASLR